MRAVNNTTIPIIHGMPSDRAALAIEETLLHAHAVSISLSGRPGASGFTRTDQIIFAATFSGAVNAHHNSLKRIGGCLAIQGNSVQEYTFVSIVAFKGASGESVARAAWPVS
jgi:hypothetical protein